MLRQAEQWNLATIIRWSSNEAVTVFPPPFDKAGQWHEVVGTMVRHDDDDSDALDIAKRMTVVGLER